MSLLRETLCLFIGDAMENSPFLLILFFFLFFFVHAGIVLIALYRLISS